MSIPRKRRVVVLGSTGSIGESALKVARDIPKRMEIVAIAANKNARRFAGQIQDVRPLAAALTDPTAAAVARRFLEAAGDQTEIAEGPDALCQLATLPEADLVLIAIVGTAGLKPALAAIEAGKDIAVASKEILVLAGEAVMTAARRKGVKVLPVDSEHNAIFQCLEGHQPEEVKRLILTASGGPFRTLPAAELADVTLERALKHPTWTMGAKITIDSSTLFNKGLEMIEARWLFDVEMARVDVIVHPQSVIHSMVEFIDGSVLAQLSVTDMCFPIQYAVTWPERVRGGLAPLDFTRLRALEFEAPRLADFPALDLARAAGKTGGTLPAVLNAANEVAVAAFLDGHIAFPRIWETVGATMAAHRCVANPSLDDILLADADARREAAALIAN
jgi:1-deoxy-D-xylulose-5-phosphate reductoisomerase